MGEHYTAVNPPPKVQLTFDVKEGKTRQSDMDGCDINKIMARFIKTGMIPVSQRDALFMDVSEMPDYRTAADNVIRANEFFESLPAKVRKRFDNDPATFLDFVSDDRNKDEMIEMGLLPSVEAPVEPAPVAAPEEPPVVPPEGP